MMKHHREPLTDRLILRIIEKPHALDMAYFSAIGPRYTTYCLAGLILDESGIALQYEDGLAVGLAQGQRAPAPKWMTFELAQVANATAEDVVIQAKAREIWAGEHGIEAAEILPLYAVDWEEGMTYDRITPQMIVEYLHYIKQGVHLMKPKASKGARVIPLRAVA